MAEAGYSIVIRSLDSDETAIFPRKATIRVVLASLISEPNGGLVHRADLTFRLIAVELIAELHVNPAVP